MKHENAAIMLAVNDPDNGHHTGQVDAVTLYLGDIALSLVGPPMRCYTMQGDRIKLGRKTFPYSNYRSWVGNWCWDQILVRYAVAAEILNYLRERGWGWEMGWQNATERWDSGEAFTADILKQLTKEK